MKKTTVTVKSAAGTEAFAEAVGRRLRGGEVIELCSDLGGGKTTFVRGLVRGTDSSDHVASPTFTISREYKSDKFTIYHFDFYRLHEAGMMADELHELIHDPHAVVVVEWSDIVQHVLPGERLKIEIAQTGEDGRKLELTYPENVAYLLGESV